MPGVSDKTSGLLSTFNTSVELSKAWRELSSISTAFTAPILRRVKIDKIMINLLLFVFSPPFKSVLKKNNDKLKMEYNLSLKNISNLIYILYWKKAVLSLKN